jgi:hypothetical protein
MVFNHISLSVVFVKSAEEGSELNPLISVGDELEQDVPGVLLEDVKRKENREKVAYFLLETCPHLALHVGQR